MKPFQVLREKYDPDIRFLWRKYYLEIKAEVEERKRIEKLERERNRM